MSASIRRDPFARETLLRRNGPSYPARSCEWCGNFRTDKHGDALPLFQYGVDRDSSNRGPGWETTSRGDDLLFCSISCHDSYTGR